MAVAVLTELSALENTLGLPRSNKFSALAGERPVPVLQTNDGPRLVGLATIASHLVKQARKEQLLGASSEERAAVQQWLEYRVTRIDGRPSREEADGVLRELSAYLQDRVYLAGNRLTLADILAYHGLHPLMVALPVHEKERYVNVSRWFSHVQQYPGVKQHLPAIVFLKNRLYARGP
ncbi:eukaryotic translation elongation factor 1 epsilon-1 [Microcaecilia unicolor]|uniref:Eukaryotic translation elongation factor 1 epsilon-1 n=1 Tax=Microcaecilia unicolor TaxID=1415580 RepID=A0A6P7ZD06_9AMPH|nr:eukaryotic translation elongation factor 1 epsilon-1 [Microcaecilia unicolor]